MPFPTASKDNLSPPRLIGRIFFGLAGACVGNGEAAVAASDDFKPMAVAAAFKVGDERFDAVVGGVRAFGGVQHPQVEEAGAFVHGLPGFGAAGFVRAVIHDGDAGMNGVDECLRVGEIHAVMVDEIEAHVTEGIVGADERNLFGLGEVAEIEKAECAEANEDAGGAGIFSLVEVPFGFAGAIGIWCGLDAGNVADVFAVGGDHGGVETGDVDHVAGMQGAARGVADGFDVGGVVFAGDVGVFAVDAVVEELADFDVLDKVGNPADVVGVEVGDEDFVDRGDAGVLHCGLDAAGVAAVVAAPAGVDEQGVARRRNNERGLAAFDVDGVDEEAGGIAIFGLRGGGEGKQSAAEGDGGEG